MIDDMCKCSFCESLEEDLENREIEVDEEEDEDE